MGPRLLAESSPIAELRIRNVIRDSAITEWLSNRGYSDSSARYQGLKARGQDMAIILDAKSAAIVGIAPFTPWD